jgi:hypothetical protein
MRRWKVKVKGEMVGTVMAIDQYVACRAVILAWGLTTFELFPMES